MNKERIKNVLLVFLVAINFILGSKILIDKKLWPDGYNFFSNTENWEIARLFNNIKDYFSRDNAYKLRLLNPERIVINTGDQTTRLSLNSSNAEFDGIWDEADAILQESFSDENASVVLVEEKEFYSVLNTNSLYLEFSAQYTPDLFSGLLGTENKNLKENNQKFSNIVISYSPRASVYFWDVENNLYYKISVAKNCEELVRKVGECIDEKEEQTSDVINYSYDLKFNEPFGNQKTTLNPLIQIYSNTEPYPVIYAKNPVIKEDMTINDNMVDKLLELFNINSSKMSHYTEAGGKMVFVENNAILKISKDAILEYEITDSNTAEKNEYILISDIANLADGINKIAGNDEAMMLVDIEQNAQGSICFDYMAEGLRVKIESDKMEHGVEAKVENKKLKSFKQVIRSYKKTAEKSTPQEFLKSLDDAISSYSVFMNEIKIDKMYLGYKDNLIDSQKNAVWNVSVNNVIVGE